MLADVSFAVAPGSFVGVLGANGAGKTTLLRAVLGLIAPSAGRIAVLGETPRRGNAGIGYMPQVRRLLSDLSLTGFDLVAGAAGGHRWGWPFASALDREAAAHALEQVGAADLARRPLSDLSGGERQRILIAEALLGSPKLLLLDEPLISLDAGHQRTIIELVHRIGEELGIAVLFCSHELNPLLHAVDEVLYLGGGKAAIGSVDEVINAEVLTRLYGTPITVLRANGRIFVLAEEIELETGGHSHDDHDHP
ncbi:MAG: ATP-binding cassette domain-containing protein [Devosia sp.]|nr:ATP-binding cassette domain-containing protein [Devosia sp.]